MVWALSQLEGRVDVADQKDYYSGESRKPPVVRLCFNSIECRYVSVMSPTLEQPAPKSKLLISRGHDAFKADSNKYITTHYYNKMACCPLLALQVLSQRALVNQIIPCRCKSSSRCLETFLHPRLRNSRPYTERLASNINK